MGIRIVIPSSGREESLRNLLESLECAKSFDIGHSINIIVVDDSKNGVLSVALADSNCKFIRAGSLGPARARNIGARGAASDDLLIFIDDDCLVPKNYFEILLGQLEKMDRKSILFGRVMPLDQNSRQETIAGRYLRWQKFLDRHASSKVVTTTCIPSANFAIYASVFFELGGFSEKFQFPGGEDDDLTLRIIDAKIEVFYDPHWVVLHDHNINMREFCRKYYRYGQGHAILFSIWGEEKCPYRLRYLDTRELLDNPFGFFSNIVRKAMSDADSFERRNRPRSWLICSLLRESCHDLGVIAGYRKLKQRDQQ